MSCSKVTNGSANSTRHWYPRDLYCVFLLLLLTIVFFRKFILFPSPVVLGNPGLMDLTDQFYPWRLFGFSMLQQGNVPLWNPYLFCGYPFIANWQSAIFYPLNLIFLCLPVYTSINYSFALHIFITGLFTYFFMRYISGSRFGALVASLTFMFSTTLILRIFAGHLSIICAIPWFPAQLLAVEAGLRTRRFSCFVLGGLALGFQLLSGNPQYVYYSLIGVLLYVAFLIPSMVADRQAWKPILVLCISLIILITTGLSLGAVQLFPSLEFVYQSSRWYQPDFEAVASNSFPPENIITFLTPNAFGDFIRVFCWGRSFLWETTIYIGILPLAFILLALFCRRTKFVYIFSAITLIFFVIGLGAYTPLLKFLHDYVPGFKLIRGNAKILPLATLFLSLLAGLGAQSISEQKQEERKYLTRVFYMIVALLLLLLALYATGIARGVDQSFVWRTLLNYRKNIDKGYWRVLDNPVFLHRAYNMFRSSVVRLLIFLGLTVVILALRIRSWKSLIYIKTMVIALIVSDLWTFDSSFLQTTPVSACWWPQGVTDFFKKDKSIFRFLRDGRVSSVAANQGMNSGFYSVGGYETNHVAVYSKLINYASVTESNAILAMTDKNISNIANMMNLKYFILPAGRGAGFWLHENKDYLPRAYIVHGAKVIKESPDLLEYLKSQNFRPREQVVLSKPLDYPLPEYAEALKTETAEILSYAPNNITIQCRLHEPGLLFLSDTFYPGWKVSVDGRPSRILRANYAFRAVLLQKGLHHIHFSYWPASFQWGAGLSLLTILAVLSYLLAHVKISRRVKHS